MRIPKVILIGGAPIVGKSAAARQLAVRLEYGCFSTDDLNQAVRAATSRESHPAFHTMDGLDYREYYTSHSVDQLINDADQYHKALWEPVKEVIKAHATWGSSTVIEGWSLQPEKVMDLGMVEVQSVWLVADRNLFEARVRCKPDFFRGASNEGQMIRHFLERSVIFNDRIRETAGRLGLPLIEVTETDSPAEICERCYCLLCR